MTNLPNLALPGNPRYQPPALFSFFGFDNLFVTVAEVEIATMQVLGEIEVIPAEDIALLTPEIIEQIKQIPTTQVFKMEREVTKHDIRAWVRLAQEILPVVLRRWTHVPLTSYDPLDTGRIIQYLRAYDQAIKPSLQEVIRLLVGLIRKFSVTLQIGRTHGQHALPITVGFWLATILYRIYYNAMKMDQHAKELRGKISGAVGAYNAQVGLKMTCRIDGNSFEEKVLNKLGLKPVPISTQILPPDPLAYFLYSATMLTASFGQFGRDCRQLMRTEIGEVVEAFDPNQVGSSTMAHKRNPINFENLEGTWLKSKNEFGKVMDTMISEHQRDLVGSCVARDFPTILVNLCLQLNTLLRKDKKTGLTFLERLSVNEDTCRRNFDMSAKYIIAEPLYIALQMAGYHGDAHDVVNHQAMPLAEEKGWDLVEAVSHLSESDADIAKAFENIPTEVVRLLKTPEKYTGQASEKAMEIADLALDYCS